MIEVDIDKLDKIVASKDAKKIALYMENHNLKLEDGKIVCRDKNYVNEQISFWDKRQLVKKINLNS